MAVSPATNAVGFAEGKHDVSRKRSANHISLVKSVIMGIVALFVLAGVFSRPIARCYHKVAQQLCHGPMSAARPQTFGQRARRVLSTTPLIGKANV